MSRGGLGRGHIIAGLGGLLLFVFLFLPWFGVGPVTESGWEGQSSTDIYLLITAVIAMFTAATAGRGMVLPGMTANGATTLLGGVASLIMLWLVVFDFPGGASREIGVYLSFLACIAIAVGGFLASSDARARGPRRRPPRPPAAPA
jgi:hypothetical protein